MKKPKLITICAIAGGLISFSVWPVLAGSKAVPVVCPNHADCPSENGYNRPNLLYKIQGWRGETNTSSSHREYCSYYICKSQAQIDSMSILAGSAVGLATGMLITYLSKGLRRSR